MKIKKLTSIKISTDHMVMFLRTFGFILVIITIYILLVDLENNLNLLASLGILISALLASFSVLLNIDTTIKLKNREISNQIRNTFFQLCLLKMRLVLLEQEKVREKLTYNDIDRIFDSFEDIHSLLNELKSENIVSIADNDALAVIHIIYFQLNTFHTHLRALRKNLIRPEPSKDNTPRYPKPLNRIDFKIDDMIRNLSNILDYLRHGYNKDFKIEGRGIESCADFEVKLKEMSQNG
ncbi:MAG: hypothetical protein U9N49_09615 [Campylobacterota bacterium]|nr:hypothetical protein [Campylobacterota bacterium]